MEGNIPKENSIQNDEQLRYAMPTLKLAHAYVPFQYFCEVYPPMEGLNKGTIFPELYMPYITSPTTCCIKEALK